MRYLATFVGRQTGAIGIFYRCEQLLDLDTPDREAARMKLYDTHEHIQGLKLTPVPAERTDTP
jgi:hypothetical protein